MVHNPNPASSGLPVLKLDDSKAELPAFTFLPLANKVPLDDIDADLVLVPKLHRMDVPSTLHPCEPDVEDLVRRTVQEFPGKKGSKKLLSVPQRNSRGQVGRHLLLVGLGEARAYKGAVACAAFETLFKQAIQLGVETVVIPFIPNAMTRELLPHKATAFKLKSVLRRLAAERGLGNLKEVKIYCHSAAVNSIKSALDKEQGDCGCKNACKKPAAKAPREATTSA